MVQSRTVEAQTFNSHVIKTILDSGWLRGSENYSNRVRVHVWNQTNRTNLRIFCLEDGVFVQTIHKLGANITEINLTIFQAININVVRCTSKIKIFNANLKLFSHSFGDVKNGHSLFSVTTINIFT